MKKFVLIVVAIILSFVLFGCNDTNAYKELEARIEDQAEQRQWNAESKDNELGDTPIITESTNVPVEIIDLDGLWAIDNIETDGVVKDESLIYSQYEETYLLLQDGVAVNYLKGALSWTGTYENNGQELIVSTQSETIKYTIISESKITHEENGITSTFARFDDNDAMKEDRRNFNILLLAGKTCDEIIEILGRDFSAKGVENEGPEAMWYEYEYPDIEFWPYIDSGVAYILLGAEANVDGIKIGMTFDQVKEIFGKPDFENDPSEEYAYSDSVLLWYRLSGEIGVLFSSGDTTYQTDIIEEITIQSEESWWYGIYEEEEYVGSVNLSPAEVTEEFIRYIVAGGFDSGQYNRFAPNFGWYPSNQLLYYGKSGFRIQITYLEEHLDSTPVSVDLEYVEAMDFNGTLLSYSGRWVITFVNIGGEWFISDIW